MFLIYYNREKADEIVTKINQQEAVPKGSSTTATSVREHPEKEKYAVAVGHLTHRSYLSELFAQERVEELGEDWFEEDE